MISSCSIISPVPEKYGAFPHNDYMWKCPIYQEKKEKLLDIMRASAIITISKRL
jgi:hypothetical protein